MSFLFPRALTEADQPQLETFDCGVDSLNRWLRQKALVNERRNASRTYVVYTDSGLLAGFFCLSSHSVSHASFKSALKRNMPNPIPVILLGRLAVDTRFKGCGLGSSMLQTAIRIAEKAAQTVAVSALVVHPISTDASKFYMERGFVQAKQDEPMLLFPFFSQSAYKPD